LWTTLTTPTTIIPHPTRITATGLKFYENHWKTGELTLSTVSPVEVERPVPPRARGTRHQHSVPTLIAHSFRDLSDFVMASSYTHKLGSAASALSKSHHFSTEVTLSMYMCTADMHRQVRGYIDVCMPFHCAFTYCSLLRKQDECPSIVDHLPSASHLALPSTRKKAPVSLRNTSELS
jgi:hypothetical protein